MSILRNKINILAIAVALFLGSAGPLFAQITLPQSNFQFTLPEGNWKYLETVNVDATTHVYLYSSVPVVSKDNDTTLPFFIHLMKEYLGAGVAVNVQMAPSS